MWGQHMCPAAWLMILNTIIPILIIANIFSGGIYDEIPHSFSGGIYIEIQT